MLSSNLIPKKKRRYTTGKMLVKTTCDSVIAKVSVRLTNVRNRLGIHNLCASQRRGEAGADAEQEPRRIGAVEPPSRPRIARHVPRPLPLHLHVLERRPPAPTAAGRQDRMPYRRRAGGLSAAAEEAADGGVVATRRLLVVVEAAVDPASDREAVAVSRRRHRRGGVGQGQRGEDPRLVACAQDPKHHRNVFFFFFGGRSWLRDLRWKRR